VKEEGKERDDIIRRRREASPEFRGAAHLLFSEPADLLASSRFVTAKAELRGFSFCSVPRLRAASAFVRLTIHDSASLSYFVIRRGCVISPRRSRDSHVRRMLSCDVMASSYVGGDHWPTCRRSCRTRKF
jgi:hypothetical protein